MRCSSFHFVAIGVGHDEAKKPEDTSRALTLPRLPNPDYHCSIQRNMEVPNMKKHDPSANDVSFFNVAQARWVTGVLSMLIAVVGKESLLGLLLRQTRFEINSLLNDEEPTSILERAGRFREN
jgi:hypothetical protein